jgi:hypothetical protein
VFPKELHAQVDGCTNTLTQTTENQRSQARVMGDYYRKLLATGHGSLFRCPGPLPGATCRYVRVESRRLDHARTHEAKWFRLVNRSSALCERSRPMGSHHTYEHSHRCRLSIGHMSKRVKRQPSPCPKQGTALSSPSPRRRWDFPCRVVKLNLPSCIKPGHH